MHEDPALTPPAATPAQARVPLQHAAYFPRTRWVVTSVFFAFAATVGMWAGAIPAMSRQTGLDAAALGIVLTVHTAAYIAGMVLAGRIARFVPLRRLMMASLLAGLTAALVLFNVRTTGALAAVLVAAGMSSGVLDLAMNSEGAIVERDAGRPILLSMHAAASAGFSLASLGGSLIATHWAPGWCALALLVMTVPIAVALHRLGPRPTEMVPAGESTIGELAGSPATTGAITAGALASTDAPVTAPALASASPVSTSSATAAVPARAPAAPPIAAAMILRIGVVLGLIIAGEMSAQMWSARYLQQQAPHLAAIAGAGAMAYAGFQVVMRLMGDGLRARFGDRRVILVSLAVAGTGLATVAASSHFALSLVGFSLVGIGSACVVPCCFALVARAAGAQAPAALGTASLIAGALRIPTPLLLGSMAAAFSDAHAFAVMAVGVALAWVLARGITLGAATAH